MAKINFENKQDLVISGFSQVNKVTASDINTIKQVVNENDDILSTKTEKGGFTGTSQDLKNAIDTAVFDGAKTYQTEAELLAVTPIPSNGTPAKVANNVSDPTKNGNWSVVSGAWVQDASVLSNIDNSTDIKTVGSELQFNNRDKTTNSLGYKYIRSDFDFTAIPTGYDNSIWEIRDFFDLEGSTITLPENVTLKFNGGKLSNGTITGNNTKIEAGLVKIFDLNVIFVDVKLKEVYPQWFGAIGDGINDDSSAIQASINLSFQRGGKIKLSSGTFKCSVPLKLGNSTILEGNGALLRNQVPSLVYEPQTILDFTGQDCDGIITDPDALYRCQGATVRDLLIRGSGVSNGHSGIAFYPSSNPDVAYRKVGLPVLERVYVEFFETGVDWNIADSFTMQMCHISDVTNCMIGGQTEGLIRDSIFWRYTDSAWKIDNAAITPERHRFFSNEVEPDNTGTTMCDWKNVKNGIISSNLTRPNLTTGVLLRDGCEGIMISQNSFNLVSYGVKVNDNTTDEVKNISIVGNFFESQGAGVTAIDLRTDDSLGLSTITGNIVANTWTQHLWLDATKDVWVAGNRIGNMRLGSSELINFTNQQFMRGSVNILDDRSNPLRVTRINSINNAALGVAQLIAKSTGNMVDGFGVNQGISVSDDTLPETEVAKIRYFRDGADDQFSAIIELSNGGAPSEKIRFIKDGRIRISGNGMIEMGGARNIVGNVAIVKGTGSPNGVTDGTVGTIYLRTDGGAGTTFYVKESGTGNTGWVGK